MKTNRLSIKLKITLWYTLILIFISSITLFTVISLSNDILIDDTKENILRSVDNFSRMLKEPHRDNRKAPQSVFFDKGVHMSLYNQDGEQISGFIPFDLTDDDYSVGEVKEVQGGDENYITYACGVVLSSGDTVIIRAAASVANESSMLRSVMKTNFILTFVMVIASSFGGYFIIKRSFKPVERISNTAKEISKSSDLSQRISIGESKDEISRLANTFDEMLDKIESTLENEKQFTSDASHELRTPIAVIKSECEYALECAETMDEMRESVMSVKRQSDRMSRLVSELLMISRMDKKALKLNFEDTDISELISFVCDEQEEIHDGNILLTREIKENVHACADRFLLTRLFVNLLSNAYQYSKECGNIRVTLSDTDENVMISVSDDGVGIAQEDLPRIWERFYRADKSRTNESGNMGLGLSMVKWIAEHHNGSVTVDSELGLGSTFTFVFPKR